ncbi:MAG: hypothetical protein KKE17_09825 [Proteobacteria bacterium]|nr:hypothetical protein [Pseudomonadota bacterium]MBU1710290.1 hypothetical protein [Pseudomonadota bacterium]
MHRSIPFSFLCVLFLFSPALADQTLVSAKISTVPIIDGKAEDDAWAVAKAITTHDMVADLDIIIKSVYTDEQIFFLVTFADADESRLHRSWKWDKTKQLYGMGPDREDIFVLKWNLSQHPVDLSIYADNPYTADIWFWKACRTDPQGYADDKIQVLSSEPQNKAEDVFSKSGKTMFLLRTGDQGKSTYKSTILLDYQGDIVPQFTYRQPTASRADVQAKGIWANGRWTLEFARKLNTRHLDDIQFTPVAAYQFGVSRYEIAGRPEEPESEQPKYGTGDVSENLTLIFGK